MYFSGLFLFLFIVITITDVVFSGPLCNKLLSGEARRLYRNIKYPRIVVFRNFYIFQRLRYDRTCYSKRNNSPSPSFSTLPSNPPGIFLRVTISDFYSLMPIFLRWYRTSCGYNLIFTCGAIHISS